MKYEGKAIEDGHGPYRWRAIRRSPDNGFLFDNYGKADDLTTEEAERLKFHASAADCEIRPLV